MTYGSAKNNKNITYISAGIGVGAGLILNGELYHGTHGYSGELGHMSIERNGLKCPCGNRGCWEMYASEKAFLTKMGCDEHTADLPFSDYINDNPISNEVRHVQKNN